jgi:hypothetical protein
VRRVTCRVVVACDRARASRALRTTTPPYTIHDTRKQTPVTLYILSHHTHTPKDKQHELRPVPILSSREHASPVTSSTLSHNITNSTTSQTPPEPVHRRQPKPQRPLGCCKSSALTFSLPIRRRRRRRRHKWLQRSRTSGPAPERLPRQPRRCLHIHRQHVLIRDLAGNLSSTRSVSGIPLAATCWRSDPAAVRAQERLRTVPRVAELPGLWGAVPSAHHLQLDERRELDAVRL